MGSCPRASAGFSFSSIRISQLIVRPTPPHLTYSRSSRDSSQQSRAVNSPHLPPWSWTQVRKCLLCVSQCWKSYYTLNSTISIKVLEGAEVHDFERLLEEALAWSSQWFLGFSQSAGRGKELLRGKTVKLQKISYLLGGWYPRWFQCFCCWVNLGSKPEDAAVVERALVLWRMASRWWKS
jgi:hypothetical protein